MRLTEIYARFYRSLNYDYMRASNEKYEPDPWDRLHNGVEFPFVRLRMTKHITTVVGGNESGKSQMLRAIKAALTGAGYDRSDFCRYSEFFGRDKTLVTPEFGFVLADPTKEDRALIAEIAAIPATDDIERIAVFRMNHTPKLRAYVQQSGAWSEPVNVKTPTALRRLGLPVPFDIDADIPLPDSVPLEYLATGKASAAIGRDVLRAFWDTAIAHRSWFSSDSSVAAKAKEIAATFGSTTREVDEEDLKQFKLAADLLLQVANLDRSLFVELQDAVRTKNGYANSIVDTVNSELAKALNFPHWWSQDSHFELFVSLYEYDLVFMIRDRTGRSYGFDERSDGLKYFLSYFVQYLSHVPPDDGGPELLLMDEPDRFLSSSGQQDLLRIFEDFARPQDPTRAAVQVAYVTHSPFLIDKNDAARIRVVEKGEHDEGTRLVSSVAANHYEPLRSAFGGFVAETAFIGNCNLMVEGPSDQVLLAGATRWLAGMTKEVSTLDLLDLNSITLVPAGGTRHIPYLVYLARGRDAEKPAVIVLLDGDKPGSDARETLMEGGAYGSELIKETLVLQISDEELDGIVTDNQRGRVAIEDLVPLGMALEAAQRYCNELVPDLKIADLEITLDDLYPSTETESGGEGRNKGILDALEKVIKKKSDRPRFHLDKVAFARGVIDTIEARSAAEASAKQAEVPGRTTTDPTTDAPSDDSTEAPNSASRESRDPELAIAKANFTKLLAALAKRQRDAVRDEDVEKISSRIKRVKKEFLRTQRGTARREQVVELIEQISSQLDNSLDSEDVRATMRGWRERFKLDEDPRSEVDDYQGLLQAVEVLAYQAARRSETADA